MGTSDFCGLRQDEEELETVRHCPKLRNLILKWLGTQFHYWLDDILDCGLGNFIGFITGVKWMMQDSRRRLISIEDFNNRPTLWSPSDDIFFK